MAFTVLSQGIDLNESSVGACKEIVQLLEVVGSNLVVSWINAHFISQFNSFGVSESLVNVDGNLKQQVNYA